MADDADTNAWTPPDPVLSDTPPTPPTPSTYGAQPYGYPYGAAPQVRRAWVVQAPPGTPYHRMARTAAQRWWRPIAGTAAILVTSIVAMLVMMVAVVFVQLVVGEDPDVLDEGSGSDSIFGNATLDLGFDLLTVAIFLPFTLLAVWVFQRRRPGTLTSVAGRVRWRWMLVCCGLALGFCVVSYATSWVASNYVHEPTEDMEWVGWGEFIPPALVILLIVPFQSAAEEYFFRGWLLQSIAGCTLETRRAKLARMLSVVFRTPWPAIVISGAVFVSGHGYTGWGMLDIFCFAVVTGWLAVRTGGLEASIALHVFNNFMAFLLPAAVGMLDIEQGAVAWQFVLADLVPMVLFAAAVVWLARRRGLRTVTGGPEPVADDLEAVPVRA